MRVKVFRVFRMIEYEPQTAEADLNLQPQGHHVSRAEAIGTALLASLAFSLGMEARTAPAGAASTGEALSIPMTLDLWGASPRFRHVWNQPSETHPNHSLNIHCEPPPRYRTQKYSYHKQVSGEKNLCLPAGFPEPALETYVKNQPDCSRGAHHLMQQLVVGPHHRRITLTYPGICAPDRKGRP
jgi:hypothetical protein